MSVPDVITEHLGGGALARRVIGGDAPSAWYPPRPAGAGEWRARGDAVRRSVPPDWFSRLAPAMNATGAALARLEHVVRRGGVIVTTGQQPGLFGGPVYTWSKAISALEIADAIERATGIPTAPVFWAATDDADFAEASVTWVALAGGAVRLTMSRAATDGVPMIDVPVGDVSAAFAALSDASGSAVDPAVLDLVRRAYHPEATVGGAYLHLLRTLLEPLGVPVLDASHPALLDAERPLLRTALERGDVVARALAERSAELRAVGLEPQVAEVDGLSLVFGRVDGRKERLRLAHPSAGGGVAAAELLSPNVLLRPVAERSVLPTVAYVAGPGELAYFAQVSAVAAALDASAPLAVPRWSCTILEPQIRTLLERHGVSREDLADPHRVEGRLARAMVPEPLRQAMAAWRAAIAAGGDAVREAAAAQEPPLLQPPTLDGALRMMGWRADHVERRILAATKRREQTTMRDVATMRGALYPGGARQERTLNLLPLLARHGPTLFELMRRQARQHADALVQGAALPAAPA